MKMNERMKETTSKLEQLAVLKSTPFFFIGSPLLLPRQVQ
jgi:hypothetical protein